MKGSPLWGHSSAGRALAWHARGQEFESPCLHQETLVVTSVFLFPKHLCCHTVAVGCSFSNVATKYIGALSARPCAQRLLKGVFAVDEATRTALVALASVGAVLWTGGLIILQINRPPDANALSADQGQRKQRNHLSINAGMACAAYGSLVPLLALLANDSLSLIRYVAIGLAVLYVTMTISNVSSFAQALVAGDGDRATTSIGFLIPTVGLVLVAIFPMDVWILWTSGWSIFASYFVLSDVARRYP